MAAVTVIIPTFNRKTFILEALTSVFAQTYRDYEVVVVDDGSTDDTQEALAPFASRIQYIPKPHGGEASARNFGLRVAQSRYVAFLDSDDLWERSFLEVTTNYLALYPELGLVSTGCLVIPQGLAYPETEAPLLHGDLFGLLWRWNFITTSAVLARRDCFDHVGTFQESLEQAEDYDMWLRIARAYPVAFLNQPLCRWRRHPGNISLSGPRNGQCTIAVVEKHYDPALISCKDYQRRRSALYLSLGRVYMKMGQITEATGCFWHAITLTPYRFRLWRNLGKALVIHLLSCLPGAPVPYRTGPEDGQEAHKRP